ncbi:MAG: hypothetical protein ABW136_02975, partial [Steroidobacteraceae bacterium]
MTPEVTELLARRREALAEGAPVTSARLAADASLSRDADRVFSSSDFVARVLTRDDAVLPALLAEGGLSRPRTLDDYRSLIAAIVPAEPDAAGEAQLMRELRRLRQRELVRIAWRDLAGHASVDETLRE